MIKTTVLISSAALALWLGFVASHTYLQVRAERVKSRISIQLHPGQNALWIALPRGNYICDFSTNQTLKPAAVIHPGEIKTTLVTTTILGNGQTLVAGTNAFRIKFQVTDKSYSPIELQMSVPIDTVDAIYLNFGATF
jgi:hypothetical protein